MNTASTNPGDAMDSTDPTNPVDANMADLPQADDPQPSGSGMQAGPVLDKKLRKRGAQGHADPPLAKMPTPTLRDMVTQVYDAKVAETKASRDPRLRRGIIRSICFHSSLLLIIVKPSYLKKKCIKNVIYRYLHQPRSLSLSLIHI